MYSRNKIKYKTIIFSNSFAPKYCSSMQPSTNFRML